MKRLTVSYDLFIIKNDTGFYADSLGPSPIFLPTLNGAYYFSKKEDAIKRLKNIAKFENSHHILNAKIIRCEFEFKDSEDQSLIVRNFGRWKKICDELEKLDNKDLLLLSCSSYETYKTYPIYGKIYSINRQASTKRAFDAIKKFALYILKTKAAK